MSLNAGVWPEQSSLMGNHRIDGEPPQRLRWHRSRLREGPTRSVACAVISEANSSFPANTKIVLHSQGHRFRQVVLDGIDGDSSRYFIASVRLVLIILTMVVGAETRHLA